MSSTQSYKQHPIAKSVCPVLSKTEREMLESDLLANGQKRSVKVLNNEWIIDGWNRYEILTKNGRKVEYEFLTDKEVPNVLDYVISMLQGRQMTPSLSACSAAIALDHMVLSPSEVVENLRRCSTKEYREELKTKVRKNARNDKIMSLSKRFGAGYNSVTKARTLYKNERALFNKVINRELTLSAAYGKYRLKNGNKNAKNVTFAVKEKREFAKNSAISIAIPSVFDSEFAIVKFMETMIEHGWKVEIKGESDANNPKNKKWYVNFFGHGHVSRHGSWLGWIPDPKFTESIVRAGVERLNKPAAPSVDMSRLVAH